MEKMIMFGFQPNKRVKIVLGLITVGVLMSVNFVPGYGSRVDRNVSGSCNQQSLQASEERFMELQELKNQEPGSVSNDLLQSSAWAYIAEAEKCYSDIEAQSTGQDSNQGEQGTIYYEEGQWVPGDARADYQLFGRKWGADSPFTVPPGTPGGTVTYSFMPNGVDLSAEGVPAYGSNLAITSLPGYQTCFLTDIRNALAAWSAVANIQFVEVSDNGLPFDASGATGDIRIGAHYFDGSSGVIAHAYYPPPNGNSGAGDLHFDKTENWKCDSSGIDIGVVALHELGHSIGLAHENTSTIAVMDPIYNPAMTSLQTDDIKGAVAIYGSATPPEPPILVAPNTTVASSVPPFEWNVSTGATAYRLAVYSYPAADYVILDQVSLSYCDASRCSYPSPISLPNGTYKFKVLAYYSGGVTPYSDWMWFTVDAVVLPFAPLAPSGTIDGVSKPDFEWRTYPGATAYRLAMYSNAVSAYLILDTVSTSYCDSTQCTYPSPISLGNGDYKFKVLAYTSSGMTPYTDWMEFTVTGVTAPPPSNPPVPISPSGTVTIRRPTLTWGAVEYATFYRLALYSNAAGAYLFVENVYPGCVAGVCSYTLTDDLVNGTYKFKLLARNSSGYTAYGSFMTFTVSSNLPVAPMLLAPSGTVGENPPGFQWGAVAGATSYRLAVYSNNTGSYIILTTVYPGFCGGGVCSYTPPSALASGEYKFKMLAYNAYGASNYSAFMSFTVP